jgi:hypothetical protein
MDFKGQLKTLEQVCVDKNYNFLIQYWDGDWNIYVSDNGLQIETEVASIGGYESLSDLLTHILKMI